MVAHELFRCSRLKEVFTEQPSDERQNIYLICEYVEYDLERYLKLNHPLNIDQIRVCRSRESCRQSFRFSRI